MMELKKTGLAGYYELQPRVISDSRGCFVKTFYREWFAEHGLETSFGEQYYPVSQRGVLLGRFYRSTTRR